MVEGACLSLVLALALVPFRSTAWDVETIRSTGAPERRIDLVVLGDGYTEEDQSLLTKHASDMMRWLFEPPIRYGEYVELFSDYRGLFNVKLVHVISNERGADGGGHGAIRDTYFSADVGCAAGFCIDEDRLRRVAMEAVPEHEIILLLVNESVFGAGSGGGVVAMTLIDADGPAVVLQHELGHVLGGLADEYGDREKCLLTGPCPPYRDCFEPNATKFTNRDEVKWKAWIDPATPVPTPQFEGYTDVVGVFPGNRYCGPGMHPIYRPWEAGCAMQGQNFEFCPVCREAMVVGFWKRASLVDTRTPAARDVTTATCLSSAFAVTTPTQLAWPLESSWSVDGVTWGGGETLSLEPGALEKGFHEVVVTVRDTTPYVRTDLLGVTSHEERWRLSVCGCSADGLPRSCDHFPRDAGGSGSCSSGDAGLWSLGVVVLLAARTLRRGRVRSSAVRRSG